MLMLDLSLRSAAIVLLAVKVVLLWSAPIERQGKYAVALVALSTSALLLVKSIQPLGLPDWAMANLRLIASLEPLAVTWLILTIFLDRTTYAWLWLVSAAAASVAMFSHYQLNVDALGCGLVGMAHHGALMGLALWSARDDLVERRCRARPWFAIAIAGLALLMTGMETFGGNTADSVTGGLIQSAGILVIVIAFALWILRPDTDRWPGPMQESGPAETRRSSEETPLDAALIARVESAMADGIWREEGLTIGALAGHLSVPEHRLRRAINQGLGHRNFSSFINAARIDAAKRELSDPAKTGTTVLEIAYQVGFASLGPFNRAFRAETGLSPTEFRRDAPTFEPADSSKDLSIPPNLH